MLHTGVTVALVADGTSFGDLGSRSRVLSETSAVLPNISAKKAAEDFAGWSVLDHFAGLPRVWQVDELGELQTSGDDLVSRQRLACLADSSSDGWLVSEKSVLRARGQGFMADQLLEWLAEHLSHPTPALLATAICNWMRPASAFVGKVQLLQITRAEARDAILHSTAFQPLLAGHIPPDWFIIRDEKAAEAKRLMKRLGFRVNSSYDVASLDEGHNPIPDPKQKSAARRSKKRSRVRRRV